MNEARKLCSSCRPADIKLRRNSSHLSDLFQDKDNTFVGPSKPAIGTLARFSFTPTPNSLEPLPPNNSLHLMTTVEESSNTVENTKEQSDVHRLALQLQKWPHQTSIKLDEVAALSDSSVASDASLEDSPAKGSHAFAPLQSDKTPICRFFKHGKLIRKPTLSKARKRKSVPLHKKEIFGSPFNADYFAKPLATGLSTHRFISRDTFDRKGI